MEVAVGPAVVPRIETYFHWTGCVILAGLANREYGLVFDADPTTAKVELSQLIAGNEPSCARQDRVIVCGTIAVSPQPETDLVDIEFES